MKEESAEFASAISRQNVAKEGWTTYYVDDANGNNGSNGLTWVSAFKTIQHAINTAESWAKIYVKNGTYAENVVIPASKDGIILIGERKETTIIHPSVGIAVDVLSTTSTVENFFLNGGTGLSPYSIRITGDFNLVEECYIDSDVGAGVAFLQGTSHSIVDGLITVTGGSGGIGILTSHYCEIKNCDLEATATVALSFVATMPGPGCSNCIVHDNIFHDSNKGIDVGANNTHLSIYHNSFIGNATQVADAGANNKWWENYYDDHTTDTNNDGLCDTPYTFTTGTDYAPVSKRNGWNQISLGFNSGGGTFGDGSVTKAITFTNLVAAADLFTVTGDVIVRIIAVVKTNCASAGACNAEVGIAADTDAILPATDVTLLAAQEIWHNATPDSEIEALVTFREYIITDGNDIIITPSAQIDSGAISFYCFFTSLSSGATVVAAP